MTDLCITDQAHSAIQGYWCNQSGLLRLMCVCGFLDRACLVMAQLLEDSSFCEEFIQQCPAAVEVLNLVAQECSPGMCQFIFPFCSVTYFLLLLLFNFTHTVDVA